MLAVLAACAKGGNSSRAPRRLPPPRRRTPPPPVTVPSSTSQTVRVVTRPKGKGLPGAFPPLSGNPVVTGNPKAVIAIVANGLDGRVVVNGQAYSGIMPRWKGVLSDAQIAAAITYIRSSWHNRAPGVTEADVAAVK